VIFISLRSALLIVIRNLLAGGFYGAAWRRRHIGGNNVTAAHQSRTKTIPSELPSVLNKPAGP
jgi:hypothetical protein